MAYSLLPCLCAQPQKPYNVLGTLADQMTYPDEHAGELSREALFEVLEQVDLTYLLDRDGVMVSHTIDAFRIRSGCSEVDASEAHMMNGF